MVGSFQVPVTIATLDGQRKIETRALVDTASTLVVIPPSMAETLGLIPLAQERCLLGEDKPIYLPVSNALITIDGRTTPARVAIGPAEATPILGVTVLELLALAVDPLRERLVPIEYLLTRTTLHTVHATV